MKIALTFSIASLLAVGLPNCKGDTILLVDGSKVSATVTSFDFGEFTLKFADGKSVRMPVASVFSINFDSARPKASTKPAKPAAVTKNKAPAESRSKTRPVRTFPSVKELTAAVAKARLTADIPWRKSRTSNDFIAIYRSFNGPSGNYVSSAQLSLDSVSSHNEVNCMLEGPSYDRVDKVRVEAECYHAARSHITNTLQIFVNVLKQIDPELPQDAIDQLGEAMTRPRMVGRWKVEVQNHRAGVDVVATMQR